MSELDRRRLLGGAIAAAGAAVAGGCSGDAAVTTPTSGSADSVLCPPDTDTIHDWISRIVARGIRRPGYAADQWTERFIADRFRQFGLRNVRFEPVEVTRWDPGPATLVATPDGAPPRALDCFALPYAATTDGLYVELVALDPANAAGARGAAALVDAPMARLPATAVITAGNAPADTTNRVYDPGDTLRDAVHVLPHTVQRQRIVDGAVTAGAAAFIGALVDYPGGGYQYYVPYDGVRRPIPSVWISGNDGAWLRAQLAHRPVRISLKVAGTATKVVSHNVVGELAGADDDIVMVGSHHDGPWASAVEDASGTALVLAQAQLWASRPVSARPHRMVFVVQAGHMCGAAGLDAFISAHRGELDRTVVEVHLEHAALEAEVRNGHLVPTQQCTPRWFFTSRIARLESAVIEALRAEDLRRSMLVTPTALGANPPTDGGAYYGLGVPIVQFLGAPSYLFDPADTLDKIDRANLVPLTRAVARIIASTAGVGPAAMRAG